MAPKRSAGCRSQHNNDGMFPRGIWRAPSPPERPRRHSTSRAQYWLRLRAALLGAPFFFFVRQFQFQFPETQSPPLPPVPHGLAYNRLGSIAVHTVKSAGASRERPRVGSCVPENGPVLRRRLAKGSRRDA